MLFHLDAGNGFLLFTGVGANALALYTDPGSGALIWQILVAAFIGGLFYIRKFKSLLSLKKRGREIEPKAGAVPLASKPDEPSPRIRDRE